MEVIPDAVDHRNDLGDMRKYAVADHEDVGNDKDDKDRSQDGHRFLDAADIEHDQYQDQE